MAKACKGLVPASDLTAPQSSLIATEKRVAELERDLKAAKAEAGSVDERAKATAAAVAKERKVSDALIVGLQIDLSKLQDFVAGCRLLIGKILDDEAEAQLYDARQCVTTLVDSAALSATCIHAYLQEISPTEVIPSELTDVWRYLEKDPAVVEFMSPSTFRRGAATALSLGLANFPDDFDLDDVTSGYPSSTSSVEIFDVLKLTDRAAVYSDRVLAMGDLLPYQDTIVAANDPELVNRDFKVEQPFRAVMAGALTTYTSNPWVPFVTPQF